MNKAHWKGIPTQSQLPRYDVIVRGSVDSRWWIGCVGEGGEGGVASSQANGVGASGGVVDGGAGGLGHRPLVPHLLAVVAAPEAHRDVIIVGQGDGLLKKK